MIRHHVSKRAGLLVISAALLHAHFLRGGDLHAFDVTPVPDRFKNAVTESKDEDVLHGFLAEIMIDSINLIFLQYSFDIAIQFLCRLEVRAEGLFDYYSPPAVLSFFR